MRALSGRRASQRELLLAGILDRLSTLVWFKTKDGLKGRNRPKSVLERLLREDEKENKAFAVPADELEEHLKRIRES